MARIWMAVVVVLSSSFCGAVQAQDGSGPVDTAAPGVLLAEGFGAAGWQNRWPGPLSPGPDTAVVTPPATPDGSPAALYIPGVAGKNFPGPGGSGAGAWGEYSPAGFQAAGTGVDVTFFRFYFYMAVGSRLADQLKLVGVYADNNMDVPTGRSGIQPDGTNYARVMLALQPDFTVHFYVYHMDQGGTYGNRWNTDIKLVPGQWYCLELGAGLGTPNGRDGWVRAWVNGVDAGGAHTDVRFRTITGVKFNTWTLECYHGGSESYPQDQDAYMDNVVIVGDPPALVSIGPSNGAGTPVTGATTGGATTGGATTGGTGGGGTGVVPIFPTTGGTGQIVGTTAGTTGGGTTVGAGSTGATGTPWTVEDPGLSTNTLFTGFPDGSGGGGGGNGGGDGPNCGLIGLEFLLCLLAIPLARRCWKI
jgi:hypothetical protein